MKSRPNYNPKTNGKLKKILAVPKEKEEQIKVVVWMDKRNLVYFGVMNQRRCGQAEMLSLKRQGLKPGVQDLIIPMARGKYHGMAVEMKRIVGGVMRENQRYWRDALTKQGWYAIVANGAAEAIIELERYLALQDGEGL